jgi:CMP-N-acetylneuraminic acid synthetase
VIAYTIAAALQSAIFSAVVVSTDSELYADVARYYGAEVPFLRPVEFASELSPDIEWVEYTLKRLQDKGREYDCFSILRPTSPFRRPETIQRAWREFLAEKGVDSLRAVERCKQHPGKMWVVSGKHIVPLLPFSSPGQPWHSSPYQLLPEVYVQNASLEIAWTHVVFEEHTIAGTVIKPFFTEKFEGFDLNDQDDWILAEHIIETGVTKLPHVPKRALLCGPPVVQGQK